ncbi:MAG TPA: diguanylate cyclase [Anaeromyxobacteraceae bacterium]|nr:diguanylate cyclase [Anaeromyxobacteraceae bacterium]
MPHFLKSHLSRKILVATFFPLLVLLLAGVATLASFTRKSVPGLWVPALAFACLVMLVMVGVHFLAMRLLLERRLARIVASLSRAHESDFLLRAPVDSEDELGELGRGFNAALAAITDLHVRQIEDARSLESLERELALKAEAEAHHRELDVVNQRLEARVRELHVLSELSRTFNSTLRLDELVRQVTDSVGRALGYSAFALLLVDEPTGELEVKSVLGVGALSPGEHVRRGEGVAGRAAEVLEKVLVTDTRSDERFRGEKWTGGQVGSILALPMVSRGACVGVLDFFRPVADGFADSEVEFLKSVADLAAIAIANARLHERTVLLSLTDPVTGLHNRRSLFARLEMELARAERFAHGCALAMIDVDHFKNLSAQRGGLAADATLRQVAQLIAGVLRRVDTLARYRGEELALLIPRATSEEAAAVAEKLRRLVAETSFEHGKVQPSGRVTISVGVASYPEDALELALLLDCADAALFAAKRKGRDVVAVHAPGMRQDPGRRRSLEMNASLDPVEN